MSEASVPASPTRGMLRHVPRQVAQVLLWSGYGGLVFWQFDQFAGRWSGLTMIAAVLALGLWGATEALRAACLRRDWLRLGLGALALRMVPSVLALAASIQVLIFVLLKAGLALGVLAMPGGGGDYSLGAVLGYWINTSVMLGLWLAVWLGVTALARSRRAELARLRAEAEGRQRELEALRARLNPHFVFNALNNVRALINEDPERARTLVTRLSNTLRHALVHSQRDEVTLAEEWGVMQDYLAVESAHFEGRLHVDAVMAPGLGGHPLPAMLLQLLVENAIKHGIAMTPGGGRLTVRAEPFGTGMRLSVENPGHLDTTDPGHGTGIGLAWLHGQLDRMRPAARFTLSEAGPGTVRAELVLPA